MADFDMDFDSEPLSLNGVYFSGVNLGGAATFVTAEGQGAVSIHRLSCPSVISYGLNGHEAFRAEVDETARTCDLIAGDAQKRYMQNKLLTTVIEYCHRNGLEWIARPLEPISLPNSDIGNMPSVSDAKATLVAFTEGVENCLLTIDDIDELDTVLTNTVGVIAKRQTQVIANVSRKINVADAVKLVKAETAKVNRTLCFDHLPRSFIQKIDEYITKRVEELLKIMVEEEGDSKGGC